jgi:hypothetical protein
VGETVGEGLDDRLLEVDARIGGQQGLPLGGVMSS